MGEEEEEEAFRNNTTLNQTLFQSRKKCEKNVLEKRKKNRPGEIEKDEQKGSMLKQTDMHRERDEFLK